MSPLGAGGREGREPLAVAPPGTLAQRTNQPSTLPCRKGGTFRSVKNVPVGTKVQCLPHVLSTLAAAPPNGTPLHTQSMLKHPNACRASPSSNTSSTPWAQGQWRMQCGCHQGRTSTSGWRSTRSSSTTPSMYCTRWEQGGRSKRGLGLAGWRLIGDLLERYPCPPRPLAQEQRCPVWWHGLMSPAWQRQLSPCRCSTHAVSCVLGHCLHGC